MKILFIADPLASFKISKDSTFAMMEEANLRGHELFSCEAQQLFVAGGKVYAQAQKVKMLNTAKVWFTHESSMELELNKFDAVLMRKDPPFDLEYLYATQLLTLAETQGARVYNKGQALRDFNEKLAVLNFAQFAAPTIVCSDSQRLRQFIATEGDVILKPLDGMGGAEIFRVTPNDVNLSVILETITRHNQRTVMAQRYIPEIINGDKRILIIAGQPLDYCLARIPKNGETRGNLAAGGHGEARLLSENDRKIANGIAPILWEKGIFLAGLDVIGNYLTEVNVTSPTCFRQIMTQTGLPVAARFIDELENCCAE